MDLGFQIRNGKDVAGLSPQLRAAIEAANGPDVFSDISSSQQNRVSSHSATDAPRSIYDPKAEQLLKLRLTDAIAALDNASKLLQGNSPAKVEIAKARAIVQESLASMTDLGPTDGLRGLFTILERVRKAWRETWFSWPVNNSRRK